MISLQRTFHASRAAILGFSFAVVSMCLVGCGNGSGSDKATGDVTITVTSGGQPVTSGRVDLETDRPGEGSGADLDSSGVAHLRGVTIGDYSVLVTPSVVVQVPGVPAEKKSDPAMFPVEFRSRKTSPLKIHVEEGSSSKTFDLKEAK